ncbi:cytochrome-c peroxidase [Terrimonas ferruginea]|uniref:cytochrome-c peroxidase n=1 Tax=Terrimonas ferruginea TaxID=249 RepID=UPI000422B73B|nr:cytochrome c peroxidase [Terrimonas ferruginea]
MKKWAVLCLIVCSAIACTVAVKNSAPAKPKLVIPAGTYEDTLRFLYSLSPDQWPAPSVDSGVVWKELGVVLDSPLKPYMDSLRHLIGLGKMLFFDPRLSGSNQISCASCHVPDLSWTDGRGKSVGHDQQSNKRNAPSILNVWYYERLFWDGRSHSLEDQAFSPINSEIEMHSDMPEVMAKLRRIPGYRPFFDSAFGRPEISPETVTEALAAFQRTVVSRKADFDDFLSRDKQALSDAALRGLHIFRTKARCMNCHNGPLFTDNSFHNIGLTYYQRENEDLGRYKVTGRAEDVGRFKTPSLRDVIRTRPWMHNGLFDNIEGVINMYNAGMPQPKRKPEQAADTLFPRTDVLIKKLDLNKQERDDLIAFLHAITAEPLRVKMPVLPK